jgi:hypothetical protein
MLTHFLPMSAEQLGLFLGFVAECPGASALAWESVDIDVIGEKRVLCLQAPWQPGQDSPIYAHYFPGGLTDAEMRAITDQHGLPDFTPLGSRDE